MTSPATHDRDIRSDNHLSEPTRSLRFWAGSIAVHVFERTFLERMMDDAVGLPFHRVSKKAAYIDEQGGQIKPKIPNAIKFERFIFDRLCRIAYFATLSHRCVIRYVFRHHRLTATQRTLPE